MNCLQQVAPKEDGRLFDPSHLVPTNSMVAAQDPKGATTLKEITFGLAAAEEEMRRSPDLLLQGFLDLHGHVAEVRDGYSFLILGPKGSGKSAIAARIQLLSRENPRLRVSTHTLASLPFPTFTGILPGPDTPELKFTSNWEFLLLVLLADSFSRDEGHSTAGTPTLREVTAALGQLGLAPGKTIEHVIKTVSDKKFKVGLKTVFSWGRTTTTEERPPDIRELFGTLRDTCLRTKPGSHHLLFIDGLDDIPTKREAQYVALAALVTAVERLNRDLSARDVAAKIVLLCRTDLFDRLPGPNKNKTLQDNTVQLEWYQDTRDPRQTHLAQLINLRATLAMKKPVDVFETLLPAEIHGTPTANFLFDHTRHTPRDVVELLNYVQKHSDTDGVTEQHVLNGIREYSESYFRHEIEDEVAKFPGSDSARRTIQAIGMLGKIRFELGELERVISGDDRFKGTNLHSALEQLFECSAIGCIQGSKAERDLRVEFKFRNRSAVFYPGMEVLVHRGLIKALNLR
jgi:hypothetical protein